MHLIEIPERGIKRYMPEDLSECDRAQYIDMSFLVFKYQTKQINYDDFCRHGAVYLLKIKQTEKEFGETELNEILFNYDLLAEQVDTFFYTRKKKNGAEEKIIKQHYLNNHIPKFRLGIKNYYGPTDEFNNISFGEYVDALNFYDDFNTTGDVNSLYLLIATFYREPKNFLFIRKRFNNYDLDPRSKYNSNRVSKLAEKFKVLPFGFIYGFYLFFASFQIYLSSAKVYISGKEIDLSILVDDSLRKKMKESTAEGLGMKSVLYTISESGVFGSLKEVEQTKFWEIYLRLYDITKRDLDFEANQPKK